MRLILYVQCKEYYEPTALYEPAYITFVATIPVSQILVYNRAV